MLLSARILKDVNTVNSFEYANQMSWTTGDTVTVHIQLIDASKDKALDGFKPTGRRFIPDTGSVLTVTLESMDDAKSVTRVAVQPFATDGSIWSFQILSTDLVSGTPQLRLSLNQGSVLTSGLVKNSFKIFPNSNSSC